MRLYGKPYPDYELTSLRGKIKRLEARLAELDKLQATPTASHEVNGVQIVEDTTDNRLRLIFPDKPNEATRALLKTYGFRWSPRAGAWQRQLTNNARYAVMEILSKI